MIVVRDIKTAHVSRPMNAQCVRAPRFEELLQ